MKPRVPAERDQRKYIRLDSVLAVNFRLVSHDGSDAPSEWYQGLTSNIAAGGLCLEIRSPQPAMLHRLSADRVTVILSIELSLAGVRIPARAGISWMKEVPGEPAKVLVGVRFEEITLADTRRLMRYARTKRFLLPVLTGALLILSLGIILNTYVSIRLMQGNRALVAQLVHILQESSIAKQKIKAINVQKEELALKMQALQLRIKTLEEEVLTNTSLSASLAEQQAKIDSLIKEKALLQEQLIAVQRTENIVTEELLKLDERKAEVGKENLDKMYRWLEVHQHPRTGLVMSFEGDSAVAGWGFLYDQSLASQAFLLFNNPERAKKLLEYTLRRLKRSPEGLFYNAYYISDGAVAEYTVHSGPNIWLGIACCQYARKTDDRRFLGLAEEIARAVMRLQDAESGAGVRGGPGERWFSTEHNLDAYAFLRMLYTLTGTEAYAHSAENVLQWLLSHTYDSSDVPVKRGRGDATIATDTYAWSIAALGPALLAEKGLNPDRIMEFAEETCVVQTSFRRPEGAGISVKGFDFAAQKNLARGGVISTEWTAQMVLSYKLMARYYYAKNMIAKARAYETKADEYLANLMCMLIVSPSPSGQGENCLPYASAEGADTGHGWITPKGKATGSVSATVYTLFAYYTYNPLQFPE